jgi:hypothetical protein
MSAIQTRVVTEAGLAGELRDRSIQFSDLNRDELVRVKTAADYSGLGDLWLPRTVLLAISPSLLYRSHAGP